MHKTKVVPPQSHVQASCGAWRGREAADPVDYKHPYLSMAQYAELLALRFDAKRTRHAYYRAMRVLHEHFQCDPATLEETHLRDYLRFPRFCGLGCDKGEDSHEQEQERSALRPGV